VWGVGRGELKGMEGGGMGGGGGGDLQREGDAMLGECLGCRCSGLH